MEQRLSVITIAANDVAAMRKFYCEILGWKPVTGNKDIVFFKLNGFLLSICSQKLIEDISGIVTGNGRGRVTIAYNVASDSELLALYEILKTKVAIFN